MHWIRFSCINKQLPSVYNNSCTVSTAKCRSRTALERMSMIFFPSAEMSMSDSSPDRTGSNGSLGSDEHDSVGHNPSGSEIVTEPLATPGTFSEDVSSSQTVAQGRQPPTAEEHTHRLSAMRQANTDRLRRIEYEKTFVDPDGQVLGCSHYQRRCKVRAECCNLYVTCRLCHDEGMDGDHRMNRFEIKSVLCMECGREQAVGPECINPDCSVNRFAHYYCDVCNLFDDSGTPVYHCDACGICRQGRREDNFHCDKCNACISGSARDVHRCLESSLQGLCPCCLEDMFQSRDSVVFMRCGHALHTHCWEEVIKTRFTCPVCQRSMTSMDSYFRSLDAVVQADIDAMPETFRNRTERILCNDCGGTSEVPFHFHYHKCTQILENNRACGSYNTRVI